LIGLKRRDKRHTIKKVEHLIKTGVKTLKPIGILFYNFVILFNYGIIGIDNMQLVKFVELKK
tara:strand:+ start:467 stop:652 length:186 start_codon:yes stop_codon:yes gene_type:complete